MNTALQKTEPQSTSLEIPSDISVGALEMALGAGDFSRFTPGDKLRFLQAVCQSVGFNSLTLPIRIIKMDGREVMYATAEASAQLSYRDKVSVKKIEEKAENGCYIVRVVASTPDGRSHEDIGIVEMVYPDKTAEWINGQKRYVPHPDAGKPFKGKDWANAVMKCHTKASRRAILRICSLGIPDESEVDDMPRAQVSSVETISGAIEESVSSRAALLNAELEEKVIDLKPEVNSQDACGASEAVGIAPVKAQSPLGNETAGARPISQEPQLKKTEVQPPVAATAPVTVLEQHVAAPAVQEQQSRLPEPPDDFGSAEPLLSEGEKLATELELVFTEYPQPKECVDYIISQKKLVKGAGLETIDHVYATKILKNPKGFLRAVEVWVKGGRK